MQKLRITCISENTSSFNHSLLSSHGQSLLVEAGQTTYLFDTSEIYEGFSYNMQHLGIALSDIQHIVLSHNHLDHSGGLFKLMDSLSGQTLLLPPDMPMLDETAYDPDYRRQPKAEAIQRLLDYKHTTIVEEAKQLDEQLFTTGALPGEVQEQSLVLTIPGKGLVILVACGHPGLRSIVESAVRITGDANIYGIIGGLHYKDSGASEIARAVEYIKSLDPEFVVPSHCTGYKAIRHIQEVLGDKIHVSGSGQFGTGNSVTILPELTFNLR